MKKRMFVYACSATLLASAALVGCKEDDAPDYLPKEDVSVNRAAGDSSAIVATLNAFRSIAGDSLNTTTGATGGRREINWDGVPANLSDENKFPPDFFNNTDPAGPNGRKRGLVYTPASADLRVSTRQFADIDSSYASQFFPFSRPRLFSPNQSNVSEIQFKVAGTNTDAFVKAFGLVLSDVDAASSTTLEAFDGEKSLGIFKAQAQAGTGNFSFLGISVNDARITKIKLTTGNAALKAGVKDISDGGEYDLVVIDDLVYSEPVAL